MLKSVSSLLDPHLALGYAPCRALAHRAFAPHRSPLSLSPDPDPAIYGPFAKSPLIRGMEKTSLAEKYKDVSHLKSARNVVFLVDKEPSIG
jgi:hypothetical protein